jgi:hypothetical protein
MFDALFADTQGPDIKTPSCWRKINGAMRLYTLFKNAVFLSSLRSGNCELDELSGKLFSSLASVSINEAQNILLHIFKFHMRDPERQRELLINVMNYCNTGCLQDSMSCSGYRIDGLFKSTFDIEDKDQLQNKMYFTVIKSLWPRHQLSLRLFLRIFLLTGTSVLEVLRNELLQVPIYRSRRAPMPPQPMLINMASAGQISGQLPQFMQEDDR